MSHICHHLSHLLPLGWCSTVVVESEQPQVVSVTSTSGSLEPTIPSIIMPTYSLSVFEVTIFRNSIRNGTTKIPSDDILEGLYKLRIRESEKLKIVLELYDLEIHQKKAGPEYHRLKTMVKRSIEQNLRIKNVEARNGNYERNAVVKNQETKTA